MVAPDNPKKVTISRSESDAWSNAARLKNLGTVGQLDARATLAELVARSHRTDHQLAVHLEEHPFLASSPSRPSNWHRVMVIAIAITIAIAGVYVALARAKTPPLPPGAAPVELGGPPDLEEERCMRGLSDCRLLGDRR